MLAVRKAMNSAELELSVSQFVALLNQTLEFAYPEVTITGELANLRVSRNRWVYFDLKDENSTLKFFGSVYNLPGPLEDGMLLKVRGAPRLHQLYGFSVNIISIQPAGEGAIKRAAQLLQAKLAAEGLFEDSRKRPLPYPPQRIGLVTAIQSAAYKDFIKVLNARWRGLEIELIDVQVQGEAAPGQIVAAIDQFNAQAAPPDVLVVVRGGGSAEDLAAFSSELVTRAVAASRVSTLVAIGHEVDISLAELAADRRASTPSNAAELLVPDRRHVLEALRETYKSLVLVSRRQVLSSQQEIDRRAGALDQLVTDNWQLLYNQLSSRRQLLQVLNPQAILRRGYAIVFRDAKTISSVSRLNAADKLKVQLADGYFDAQVTSLPAKGEHG